MAVAAELTDPDASGYESGRDAGLFFSLLVGFFFISSALALSCPLVLRLLAVFPALAGVELDTPKSFDTAFCAASRANFTLSSTSSIWPSQNPTQKRMFLPISLANAASSCESNVPDQSSKSKRMGPVRNIDG